MAYLRPPNTVLAGKALKQNPSPTPLDPAGVLPVVLDAEIASKTNLGVVQIGDNINVTPEGVISVVTSQIKCCCVVKVVTSNYYVQDSDYYIGVKSSGPTIIYLQDNPKDCLEIVIKADMPPPIGNKKVIIQSQGAATIDGGTSVILSVSYASIRLISQGGTWHKI